MLFRIEILTINKKIKNFYDKSSNEWFDWNGGSYYKDPEAVAQVIMKGDRVKGLVELVFKEGDALPIGSHADINKLTEENLAQQFHKTTNRMEKGFWEKILRR